MLNASLAPTDLTRLLDDLHSDREAVCAAAEKRLDQLTPGELLTLIQMEIQRTHLRRAGKISLWLLAQAGIVALIVLVLILLGAVTHGGDFGGGCSGASPFTPPPEREQPTHELRILAQALARSQSPDAAPVILEAIFLNTWLPDWLTWRLEELLPRVTSEDAALWGLPQEQNLLRWLEGVKEEKRVARTLAALHALEEIGTDEAIVAVHRLTFDTRELVRSTANRCLQTLQRRSRNAQFGKELLRAGTVPSSLPEELLRAGSVTNASDPAELLRQDAGDRIEGRSGDS